MKDCEKTCGNCAFRGKEFNNINAEKTGFFLCERINHEEAECHEKGIGADLIDGSGYYAALCVEKDFGCNRWEKA